MTCDHLNMGAFGCFLCDLTTRQIIEKSNAFVTSAMDRNKHMLIELNIWRDKYELMRMKYDDLSISIHGK